MIFVSKDAVQIPKPIILIYSQNQSLKILSKSIVSQQEKKLTDLLQLTLPDLQLADPPCSKLD